MPAVKTTRKRRRSQPAHTPDLATRLVDEAGRILSAQGAAALSLRRLATATGTSTMAVYTLFGDKQGLLAAMHREGFRRLGVAIADAAAKTDDPLAGLAELGLAYRRAALANPHLYDLMFGRPVSTFEPDAATQAEAESTFQPLVDAVQRCLDAGVLTGADADRIAFYLWAVSHGMVSLELAGQLPGDDDERDHAYNDACALAATPFFPSAG